MLLDGCQDVNWTENFCVLIVAIAFHCHCVVIALLTAVTEVTKYRAPASLDLQVVCSFICRPVSLCAQSFTLRYGQTLVKSYRYSHHHHHHRHHMELLKWPKQQCHHEDHSRV